MSRRTELHQKLIDISGTSHVYFQPPETIKLVYPCIIYNRESNDVTHADNLTYRLTHRYSVLYITKDPDTDIPDKLEDFPMCHLNRCYTSDNLNHYSFDLYY